MNGHVCVACELPQAVAYKGPILYERIPLRVGRAPLLPVFHTFEGAVEAYLPGHAREAVLHALLTRLALHTQQPVCWYRVSCTPDQCWGEWRELPHG